MPLSKDRIAYLEGLCRKFRVQLIETLYRIQTGHPGGSLSSTEILTTLYFEKLRIDPANPKWEDRDRFVLGKGHAAPMLYIVLAERGFFPASDLAGLRQIGSHLQGHPCAHRTPGVELSTGPLGLGLSAGLGMALSARMDGKDFTTYVLMGDGETEEGIVWEAAMAASKFHLDNVVVLLDRNGVQLDGTVEDIMPLGDIEAKWESFGWRTLRIDGHSVEQVAEAIDGAGIRTGKPVIVIARTVKGKGVSFMEGRHAWHGKPIGRAEYETAMAELKAAT
jgi:transketolase